MAIPKIIYLQGHDEYGKELASNWVDITWCDTKIEDNDTEYILKSEYDTLSAENEKGMDEYAEMVDKLHNYTDTLRAENDALREVMTSIRNLCYPQKRDYIPPKDRIQSIFKIADRALGFK